MDGESLKRKFCLILAVKEKDKYTKLEQEHQKLKRIIKKIGLNAFCSACGYATREWRNNQDHGNCIVCDKFMCVICNDFKWCSDCKRPIHGQCLYQSNDIVCQQHRVK